MQPHVLYVGGEDHHFRIPFILAMKERGFRVTATGSGDERPFHKAGIDFVPFAFSRFIAPVSDYRSIRALARILQDVAPDIAQSYDTKPNLLLPLAARTIGFPGAIRTITGLAWVYSSRSPLALCVRPVYRALHRLASRTTAATIFEMGADQNFFEHHKMAGSKSIVIPAGGGGVDVEGFDAAFAKAKQPRSMRAQIGIGSNPVVITVTRLTRQKGIATLLEAAEIVHAELPNVRFLLVGPRESEGPLAISQAEIDTHAPYVIATGPRSDVPALLKLADVFAFPTEYREGVPRALLEAALAKLPIVTTDMPGCCDVIRNGGGRVVSSKSPRALARAIVNALTDRKASRAMAIKTDEVVRAIYGLRSIADHHSSLYANIADTLGLAKKRNQDQDDAHKARKHAIWGLCQKNSS
ncbi:MAG: glycosyltransferase [Hyphomicrobium sp.]